MVNRREAALAHACRMLVRDYQAALEDAKAGGDCDLGDISAAVGFAEEALKIKSKPSRRRAVIYVKNGVACVAWADRGVEVTIRDEDAGREYRP